MKNILLIFKLCLRYKILPLPFYFLDGNGTACFEVRRFFVFGKEFYFRKFGVSLFRCSQPLASVLHEIGHIYQHEVTDQFSKRQSFTTTLYRERFASRYAKRLLKLSGQDTPARCKWLSWAYSTYLGHFYAKGFMNHSVLAKESYKFFKQMGRVV